MSKVPVTRPETLVLAVRIKSAAHLHPGMFEPVPSHPVYVDDDGTAFKLADTEQVRGDMAIFRRLAQSGMDVSDFVALQVRMAALARILEHPSLRPFVIRKADYFDINEALLKAAAVAPCDEKRGFRPRQICAEAYRMEAQS